MRVQEHYEKHLGNFYSWMSGDFESKTREFKHFLEEHHLVPHSSKVAIDLGSGHGIQSIPLAKTGFQVHAIDFNTQLCNELKENAESLNIHIYQEDIKQVKKYKMTEPELILCCGDTLTHLENKQEIEQLIGDITDTLVSGGKLILSFRDYSNPLNGDNRFIPVKSDDKRILTCILDYEPEVVRVSDLLYEKTDAGWIQKISSYNKVRITPDEIDTMLQKHGLIIEYRGVVNRMIHLIAQKPEPTLH